MIVLFSKIEMIILQFGLDHNTSVFLIDKKFVDLLDEYSDRSTTSFTLKPE